MAELSRRDLFKRVGAAALAGTLIERKAPAEEGQKQAIELQDLVRNLVFEQVSRVIEYKEAKRELPKTLQTMILEIKKLQQYEAAMATWEPAVIREHHQKIWATLREAFPRLPAYSERTFYAFLITELPSLLAKYGVGTIVENRIQWDPKTEEIFATAPLVNFYLIGRIEKDVVIVGRSTIQRQTLVVDDLKINQEVVNIHHRPSEATAKSGVIFLYKQNAEKTYESEVGGLASNQQELTQVTDQLLWNDLARYTAEKQDKRAMQIASFRGLQRYAKVFSKENLYDSLKAHELGHLQHYQEADFPHTERPSRYCTRKGFRERESIHDMRLEARGEIGCLLFSKEKTRGMVELLIDRKAVHEANGHRNAAIHLIEAGIEEILADLNFYGITLQSPSTITPRNQVLFHFMDLAAHPQKVEHLAKRLEQRFKQGKDFPKQLSDEALPSKQKIRPPTPLHPFQPPEENGSCQGIGLVSAGVTIAAVAGVYGLVRLQKRKEEVKKKKGKH